MRTMRLALLGTALLAASVPAMAQPAPPPPAPPGAPPGSPAASPAAPGPEGRRGPAQRGPAAIFARFDANGDGRVTMDETWAYVQARFAEADRNKDGVLVLEEALAAPMLPRPEGGPAANQPAPPAHARMVAMMFRAIDANRDGKVTPEELRPAVEARFRALDANGDNGVTLDELPAPRHRGMHHGGPGAGPHGMRGPGGPDAPPPPPR